MNRLLVVGATALLSAALASAPAVFGLADNASFSHQIPVRAPQGAKSVVVVGTGASVGATAEAAKPTHSPSRPATVEPEHSKTAEPVDDNGGQRNAGTVVQSGPTADNKGGGQSSAARDDKGGQSAAATVGPSTAFGPSTASDQSGPASSGAAPKISAASGHAAEPTEVRGGGSGSVSAASATPKPSSTGAHGGGKGSG